MSTKCGNMRKSHKFTLFNPLKMLGFWYITHFPEPPLGISSGSKLVMDSVTHLKKKKYCVGSWKEWPPCNLKWQVVLIVERQISLSTCLVKFHPDGDICWQNNDSLKSNVVMFQPHSPNCRFKRLLSSGLVGYIQRLAALLRKQSSLFEGLFYLYFFFLWIISFSKCVHYYVDRIQNLLSIYMSYFLKIAVLSINVCRQ